jgi:hypothetical protein
MACGWVRSMSLARVWSIGFARALVSDIYCRRRLECRLAERVSIRFKRAKRRLLEFLSFGAVRVCVSEEFGGFRLQAVMLLLLLAFSLVREPADSGVDGKSLG